MSRTLPAPSRLHPRDLLGVSGIGLRTHRLRASLSALGTNLLRVSPGQTFGGENAKLPEESVAMISRIAPVQQVSSIGAVDGTVRRSTLLLFRSGDPTLAERVDDALTDLGE